MKIIYCNTSLPKSLKNTLVLTPDHYGTPFTYLWDDYDFKTTFKAFIYVEGRHVPLGQMKVLFKNVNNSHKYIKENFNGSDGLYQLNNLEKHEFVSIGEKIDFYKKLNKTVRNKKETKRLLKKLHDASYAYANLHIFKLWPGFEVSLLRDASGTSILQKGFSIAVGHYKKLVKFSFDTQISEDKNISFEFNQDHIFNGNINILVGKNGLGKTKTLKSLASDFLSIGRNELELPFFLKLVVVSFSPFDNFLTELEVKNVRDKKFNSGLTYEPEEIEEREDRADFVNNYAYIGLKTEKSKVDFENAQQQSAVSLIDAINDDCKNGWIRDFERLELIKNTLSLAITFEHIGIKVDDDRVIHSAELLTFASNHKDASELDNVKLEIVLLSTNGSPMKLSSGQVIYSLMIPRIVSEIVEESLILIDEPELYLHPELEVGLVSMLKLILNETSSFSIIATHSSILVREVKREYVQILRVDQSISKPQIETFGNSLDTITGYVFNDYNSPKPYQELIKNLLTNKYESIEQAINELSGEIGDDALSYLYQLKREAK